MRKCAHCQTYSEGQIGAGGGFYKTKQYPTRRRWAQTTGTCPAPEFQALVQPMFNAKDFRLFLQRYKRWSLLAGLDYRTEEMKRTWFVSSMTGLVVHIVESVFERTATSRSRSAKPLLFSLPW